MTERIGFGRRLVAALIDVTVIGIVGVLGGTIFMASRAPEPSAAAWRREGGYASGFVVLIFGPPLGICAMSVVWTACEGLTGKSPGKLLMRIRIKAADESAGRLANLMARAVFKYCPVLVFIFPLSSILLGSRLNLMWRPVVSWWTMLSGFVVIASCLFSLGASRQALHDRVAKTAVYRS